MAKKICEHCGEEFLPKEPLQKYCHKSHRIKAARERGKRKRKQPAIKKKQRFEEAALELFDEFHGWGLHVHAVAVGGSTYLQFRPDIKKVVGAIRIADHPARKHLNYRWQLRADIEKKVIDKPRPGEARKHWVYLYPLGKVGAMVAHIRNYYNSKVENNNNKDNT